MTPDVADAWGLGLSYGTVRLVTTPPEWHAAAARLIAPVCSVLGSDAIAVEHIGSTAVVGLLAKPIIDIAVLLAPEVNRDTVIATIESLGYEYRGDAGGEGGLVFVLDARPRVRVAHLHVIAHGDPQWDRYLAFVERLRTDPDAACRVWRRQATTCCRTPRRPTGVHERQVRHRRTPRHSTSIRLIAGLQGRLAGGAAPTALMLEASLADRVDRVS